MNVHLSIDDVILSLKAATEDMPDSITDVPFYKCLHDLYNSYGAVFTLYAFEGYGGCFHISQIPSKYWMELENLDFLRFGYHGSFRELDYTSFTNAFDRFCSVVPQRLMTDRLRLHRYSADRDKVLFLHSRGVTELLCRDDESKAQMSEPSYDLDDMEMTRLSQSPLTKNGMTYRKTCIKLDLHDHETLKEELKKYIGQGNGQDTLVLFIHERFLLEQAELLDEAMRILAGSGANFIF